MTGHSYFLSFAFIRQDTRETCMPSASLAFRSGCTFTTA